MAESSSLVIRLGAHVSGAMSGLRSVYSATDKLVQKASSLSVIRFGGLISMATAGLGIGGVSAKIVQLGAHAETTRLSFQTMLGSVQTGDAMMAKLDRFSNSTPYSGDQVNRAAKTLLAFGVAAGDVESTLRAVGDVAAGSGKDFNELSAIYGKVFAKGKADSEALNQMIEAGIPIVKLLGEEFGKSGDQIYTMASKGEISAGAVERAFKKMSGAGGTYASMMDKQSSTVAGMWGAITGQLEYAGSLIGEAISPMVKSVLAYFQGWADELVAMSTDGRMVQYISTVALTGISMGASLAKGFLTAKEYGVAAFRAICDIGMAIWSGVQGSATIALVGIVKVVNVFWEQTKAVFTVLGRMASAALDGYLSLVTGFWAGVVNLALKAINSVIFLLNKIPGVDIDMVKKPKFLRSMERFSQEAGARAKANLEAVASGKDFKDASKMAAEKNRQWDATEQTGQAQVKESSNQLGYAALRFAQAGENIAAGGKKIDALADRASNAVTKWQGDAQSKQSDQKNAEKFADFKRGKTPDGGGEKSTKKEKINTDSLTKIGLYGNFGGSQVRSIDKERNGLLKNILEQVEKMRSNDEVVLT